MLIRILPTVNRSKIENLMYTSAYKKGNRMLFYDLALLY